MVDRVPCIVIGAGAVGLSAAKMIAESGMHCLLLERHSTIGMENSSRNSEVLHAGIYYPNNSSKAKLCFKGRKLLLDYIKERSVPYNQCGKLIVAQSDHKEITALKSLYYNAWGNGLRELELIDRDTTKAMEPEVECAQAIWSPFTSIFDSHQLMLNYQADIEESPAMEQSQIIFNCEVNSIKASIVGSSIVRSVGSNTQECPHFLLETSQGTIGCDYLVTSAGLTAQYLSHHINLKSFPQEEQRKFFQSIPRCYYAKGTYYKLSMCAGSATSTGASPFQRLIYPMPSSDLDGLGVHATLDLSGTIRFGPDVFWIPSLSPNIEQDDIDLYQQPVAHMTAPPVFDFNVEDSAQSENLMSKAREQISRYWPRMEHYSLVPDYAGIRSKLVGPNQSSTGSADFAVHGRSDHGVRRLVCLYGIESPGLTCSLAIGEQVRQMLLTE